MNNTEDLTIVAPPQYALFLDDVRTPLGMIYDDGVPWVIVRSYDAFVEHITKKGMPSFITFDHDLAHEHYISNDVITYKEKTGYDCARWLIDYCLDKKCPMPKWHVHSMNPVGKANIIQLLKKFEEIRIL